jgi:hypothetical protein
MKKKCASSFSSSRNQLINWEMKYTHKKFNFFFASRLHVSTYFLIITGRRKKSISSDPREKKHVSSRPSPFCSETLQLLPFSEEKTIHKIIHFLDLSFFFLRFVFFKRMKSSRNNFFKELHPKWRRSLPLLIDDDFFKK